MLLTSSLAYQQVVSLAESAFPPVDLAKWLEARVGPEYVIKVNFLLFYELHMRS